MQETWLTCVSLANAPCLLTTITLHARNVRWQLANVVWIQRIRVLSVRNGLVDSGGKLRRSLVDARSRSCQRGRQHWSAAFPRLEVWILSKPVSTSASEISSQAGEGNFEDNTLVSTPNQQVEQVLVVQAQNGVSMASGTATTAPSTAITAPSTAPSTAPLQVAGPSTMEPIIVQLGQDMPSVIQGARPDVRIEQTAQSTQRYGTLPYIPGPQYTAPLPCTAPLPYAAPYATMPAISARHAVPMGYYGQGSQVPFVPSPNWMTEREQMLQQQLLQERQQFEAWRASQAQAIPQPQPQMTSAGQFRLKLDIVSCLHYAWREVHNKMLLRRSIALDCLERTLPPIDEDQKLALLHAPFKGTTLFGGEELNTKRDATFTVFPQPTVPSTSYSTRPYVRRGKSFKDKKGFKRPGGRGRGQGRSAPSAMITRPGQSKDGQKALTVSVSTDSKKHKVESQDDASQIPRKTKRNFRGDKHKGNKQ